jgi:hypothetical protein
VKEAARKVIISAVILFGGLTFAIAVLLQSPKAQAVLQIAEVRPNYETPKNPAISNALDRCLADLSKAEGELRTLYKEGKVKRFLGIQGMWQAYVKSTNTEYSMVFKSKTGPLLGFYKFVYTDKERQHELREQGYEIQYYPNGTVKGFTRRTLRDGLSFYPDGGLESFGGDLDERTSCSVSWDANGKLLGAGMSSHAPRSEKGLPDWEKILRHGDFQARSEAAGEMALIGPAAIPYALGVLKDGDDGAREQAAVVLLLLGERAAPAVPDLIHYLSEDKDPKVRAYIARALGGIGSPAQLAIPSLELAATNDVPEVASAAKHALERIRGPSSK